MARTNKVTIRILSREDKGRNHELWCSRVLMLRTARKAGDIETINHTQLGSLQRMADEIEFEVVTANANKL